MTLLPPELAEPFGSPAEREAARDRLRRRDAMLRRIETLAQEPSSLWSPAELAAFPSVANGVADPPPRRLARWASLFAEELVEVHRLAASSQRLSDVELQEVLYLAERLLATVTGWSIGRIDDFSLG